MIKKINLSLLAILTLMAIVTCAFYANFRSANLAALKSGSQIAETSAGPMEYQFIGDVGPVLLFLHGIPGSYDQAPLSGELAS